MSKVLIRQGKGWFHISGMGHEALAGIAIHLDADDYAFPIIAIELSALNVASAISI